ncbi:unnamed protein product [Arctia plantaginis]|uniref:Sulfotransferase domain-containing protein n=1 Tax=Arctia plantaginis TaxID=874455 RepID=A0A8S0ZQD0_ARCPL|nr:unnamed protein product [Arctia plantaginis]
MGEKKMPFPYEFKELEPEEKMMLLKAYKASELMPRFDLVSVGPKKFKLLRPFCEEAADIYNMALRSDDIFVVTYPRSGTTWTQELVWLVANDFDYATAKSKVLMQRFPFVEFLKYVGSQWQEELLPNAKDKEMASEFLKNVNKPVKEKLSAIPSPRFLKTHMPLSLLPPKLLDTAKVVYVARDPRDVSVSNFHLNRLINIFDFPGTFKDYWSLFSQHLVKISPHFEHVKEAWNLRHHPNMLFLFYEDSIKDLPSSIRRVADFLGKDITEDQVTSLCDHLNFENFKKNDAVNFEYIKGLGVFTQEEDFIRRGKAGGWREYFDEEMTQQADQWIANNLRDTDLRFPKL